MPNNNEAVYRLRLAGSGSSFWTQDGRVIRVPLGVAVGMGREFLEDSQKGELIYGDRDVLLVSATGQSMTLKDVASTQ